MQNNINYYINNDDEEASRGAGAKACHTLKRNRVWVRFRFVIMKYFIFSFPRSGNKAKHGVEFRHLTPNFATKIRQKVRNGNVLMKTECLNTGSQGSPRLPR